MAVHYNKPPLSISDQAPLLLNRGLICTDKARLERYLSSIGYYRLSAYWLPFEHPSINGNRNHQFVHNTDFDKILGLYIFDRKLRLLVMEAIERVEVALRSQWSCSLALATNDSHAYMNPVLFKCPRRHIRNLAKIDREFDNSSETFIQHYKDSYNSPSFPPIWAVVETMTLGTLSHWFANTNDTETKKNIRTAFGLPNADIAEKVFHALTPVRNVCAHHSRLWNRRFTISLPHIKRFSTNLVPQNSPHHQAHYLYNYLVVMAFLMNAINPGSSWKSRLMDLLNTVTASNHKAMGFPDDWQERRLWLEP
ncbi:MAG: Abi family protein [Methylobacter sp.]|jgi:abortive infection bacteriophage resistance protein|nr:Abi family protein [Methylobacter sp.]